MHTTIQVKGKQLPITLLHQEAEGSLVGSCLLVFQPMHQDKRKFPYHMPIQHVSCDKHNYAAL